METVAIARNAMATRFEILLHGEDALVLRAAGEEALDEIERLEAQLSLYRPSSEISGINARAASGPVRVEPELFRLLRRAQRLSEESGGAFDITIAPLVKCWGFMGGTGKSPDPEQVSEARSVVGMHLVIFNDKNSTIQFAKEGVMLDLGSIGKGYALERAAQMLIEAGVTSALLHGGASTVHAIGAPPNAEFWKVAVSSPQPRELHIQPSLALVPATSPRSEPLGVLPLRDESLSVSGVHGKAFTEGDKTFGHVIDPRTGQPVQGALMAAVALPSPTETDALSTALLTLGPSGHAQISGLRPGIRTLLLTRIEGENGWKIEAKGF
ncbi:MAG: FAD:protein FMN transferase [Verrucomicrobia bacterium]|nr:FAD:protein FMN transferase [Verrucomicrobiota bacterium]